MATLTVYCTNESGDIIVAGGSWSYVRGTTAGDSIENLAKNGNDNARCNGEYISDESLYKLARLFNFYDTSALGAGAIITAVRMYQWWNNDYNGSVDVNIVSHSSAGTSLVVNDYDNVGSDSFGTISPSGAAGWFYSDLDADGIANINQTGISKFALRHNKDYSNTTPTGRGYAYWGVGNNSNDRRSYLEITYTFQDLTIAVNDSISTSENLENLITSSINSSDNVSISENNSLVKSSNIYTYETVNVSEGYSDYVDLEISTVDTLTIGEHTSFYYFEPAMYGTIVYGCNVYGGWYQMDQFLMLNVSEAVSLLEELSISAISIELPLTTEQLLISEDSLASVETNIDVGDNIVVFDSPNMPIMVFISDSITISESIESVTYGQEISAIDSLSTDEYLIVESAFDINLHDVVSSTDIIINSFSTTGDIALIDSLSLTDSLLINPISINTETLSDSLSISENIEKDLSISMFVSEPILIVDELSIIDLEMGSIIKIDTLSCTESTSQYITTTIDSYEIITLSDIASQMDSIRMAPDVEGLRGIRSLK